MKRICAVISLIILLATGFSCSRTKTPPFVQERINAFKHEPDVRYAFSQIFGWGDGAAILGDRKVIQFLWFAKSNSDGYLQLEFSSTFPQEVLDQFNSVRDSLGRLWKSETRTEGNYSFTWVGTTNQWIFGPAGDIRPGNELERTLQIIRNFKFIKKIDMVRLQI